MAYRNRVSTVAALGVATFISSYGVASAACVSPTAGAPQSTVDRIMSSPAALLERFPEGQGGLVAEIRNVVATNPAALAPIAALIASANTDQRRAIGAGLGQAAAMCARSEPETARRIQEAILAADSREVTMAFQGVVGDRPTAAVGPGSSGAGGLGGGGLAAQMSMGGGGSASYSYGSSPVSNSGYILSPGGGSSVSLNSAAPGVVYGGGGSGGNGGSGGGGSAPSIIVVSNNVNNNVNNNNVQAIAGVYGSMSPFRNP